MIERRNEDCQPVAADKSRLPQALFARVTPKVTANFGESLATYQCLTSNWVNANLNRYHPKRAARLGTPIRAEVLPI